MTFLFELEGKLPGLNDIINSRARHWSIYAKQKKEWTAKIIEAVSENGSFSNDGGPIALFIIWGIRTNADLDNCTAKFILDAMVEMGLIEDDNCKFVKKITHEVQISKTSFVKVYVDNYLPSNLVAVQ